MKNKGEYSKPECYVFDFKNDVIRTSDPMLKSEDEYYVDDNKSDGSWDSLPRK